MFAKRQTVTHNDRPAVITDGPQQGADGSTIYAVRYTDCERLEPDPHFPGILRPRRDAYAIARDHELTVA